MNLDVPKCNNLVISAIIDGASGIREILHDDGVDAIYDLNGHRIDAMRKGINIVRDKKEESGRWCCDNHFLTLGSALAHLMLRIE